MVKDTIVRQNIFHVLSAILIEGNFLNDFKKNNAIRVTIRVIFKEPNQTLHIKRSQHN